ESEFKRIKIPVIVEEVTAVRQAKRRGRAVPRAGGRVAPRSELAVVPCGSHRQVDAARGEHLEFQQCPARGRKPSFAPYALQYLAQDEIRQGQPPARYLSIQPLRLGRSRAPQILNPDRCIDDDHEAWRTRP